MVIKRNNRPDQHFAGGDLRPGIDRSPRFCYTRWLVFLQTWLDQEAIDNRWLKPMSDPQGSTHGGSTMKALFCSVAIAILVATPVLGAEQVSLVGTWTGQRDRIAKDEGRRGGLATLVITEQQGNTFTGRLKRSNPTGDEEEPLWGAFTPGAKLIMGSDDEGTYLFNLINRNTLDYCYSETGKTARTVCARLTRKP
jgi:hypothetical protein